MPVKRAPKRFSALFACSTLMPPIDSAIWPLISLRRARARVTAGALQRWYRKTITSTAGSRASTISIRRQSRKAMAAMVPIRTMELSRMTNSTCTYSDFTASVSLVTRLTSCPVMARSKKAMGRRSTC